MHDWSKEPLKRAFDQDIVQRPETIPYVAFLSVTVSTLVGRLPMMLKLDTHDVNQFY